MEDGIQENDPCFFPLPSKTTPDITKKEVLKIALNVDFPIDLWNRITVKLHFPTMQMQSMKYKFFGIVTNSRKNNRKTQLSVY